MSQTRKPRIANVTGGLSGPCVKPVALRCAFHCARAVKIPVIGCGGIARASDVLEFLVRRAGEPGERAGRGQHESATPAHSAQQLRLRQTR